ncbi:Oidioi.mRNA.OKI2018_I69.PAR.g11566.t1.cds [Oikopleura dioica]|uniref:Oidioi.mRNA.OKI2018_I69.PAR.g11566.t1.cds n=1 Tax=Oikopleura dioica TaxID=34765 RepID=A0ABN7S0F6_OIKDI|nr:Oidioi.mRNA.OKI2018_I69.PAR.g11566.t1.cds [Oikopleura dioica]
MRANSTDIFDFSNVEHSGMHAFCQGTQLSHQMPDETTDYSSEEFQSDKSNPTSTASLSRITDKLSTISTSSESFSPYPRENSGFCTTIIPPTPRAPPTSRLHTSDEGDSALDSFRKSTMHFLNDGVLHSNEDLLIKMETSSQTQSETTSDSQELRNSIAEEESVQITDDVTLVTTKYIDATRPACNEDIQPPSKKSHHRLTLMFLSIIFVGILLAVIVLLAFQLKLLQNEVDRFSSLARHKQQQVDSRQRDIVFFRGQNRKLREQEGELQSKLTTCQNEIFLHDKEFHPVP